jgi:hypothetical protein
VAGLATIGLGLAVALAGLWALAPVPVLHVANATGNQTVARLPLVPEAPLRLSYVHSIYRAPAAEEFAVGDAGLALVALHSPSLAVLEYYARREPVLTTESGYTIQVAPEQHPHLAVRASAIGQRTVAYAGHELPLHRLAADGDRVTLAVERAPRLALLWDSPP